MAFIHDIELLLQPDFHFLAEKSEDWLKSLEHASWYLAGIAVLADWIGSDQTIFHYQTRYMPLGVYWKRTLLTAAKALAHLDLPQSFQVMPFLSIEQHFGFQATPLQRWVEQIAVDDSPQLFILEDVTGAGKTEAALALTHRLMAAGAADGFYFGLPTMATSNAMFDRVADYYSVMFSPSATPSIVLAHGARDMNDRFKEIRLVTFKNDSNYHPDDLSATAQCHHWLSDSRKKALLASVGVGTIDQALIAVLPRKHQSLRMLGLHRKILIFDEVHAADEYMFELMESLLSLHLHQGGSVILLTATLPLFQRQRLVKIWHQSAGIPPIPITSTMFPLATKVSIHQELLVEQPLLSRKDVSRCVMIRFIHSEKECVEQLVSQVRQGFCAVWIRNSVDDALNAYEQIVKQLDKPQNCILFHSRFTLLDRKQIEHQVLLSFGKKATSTNRQGKVLIATQVFQESIDADADLLISDICPIDDLIQRMGRLHRHTRDKNGVYQPNSIDTRHPPQLFIHTPPWLEEPDGHWLSRDFKNTQYVYRSPGRLWLGIKKLRELNTIVMPENARELIEAVYSEAAIEQIPTALKKAEDDYFGETRAKAAKAISQLLKWQQYGYSMESAQAWHDDNTDISTRYSDIETGRVVLIHYQHGQLTPYVGDVTHAIQLSSLQLNQHKYVEKITPHSLDDTVLNQFMRRYPAAAYQTLWLFEHDQQFGYSREKGFYEQEQSL